MGPRYKKNQNDSFIQEIFNCFQKEEVFDQSVETDQSALTFLSQEASNQVFVPSFGLGMEDPDSSAEASKDIVKWLDKTQNYFTNMIEQTSGEEKAAFEAIDEKLNTISDFISSLSEYLSSSRQSNRKSEQNWEELFTNVSAIRSLADDLAELNQKTKFKYADAPAMMAAQGIGRAVLKFGNILDQQILNDQVVLYSEQVNEYLNQKDAMEKDMQRHLNNCEEKKVPADKVQLLGQSLNEKILKAEQKLEKLPGADEKLKGVIERTKNGPLEKMEERELELEMMIAYKKHASTSFLLSRKKEFYQTLQKSLEEAYVDSNITIITPYDYLNSEYRYMMRGADVLDYVQELSRKTEFSEEEHEKLASAMFDYDQTMAAQKTASRERAAKGVSYYSAMSSGELAKMVSSFYNQIYESFKSSSSFGLFQGRMGTHADIRKTLESINSLQQEYNETHDEVGKNIVKLKNYRIQHGIVEPSDDSDSMWDWLDEHAYNLDVKKAEQELSETRERILEMQKNPESENQKKKIELLETLGNQTKTLQDRMKEATPKLKALSKTVNDLCLVDSRLMSSYNTLKSSVNQVNQSGQGVNNARQFTAKFEEKAQKLVARFNDNKRFFHKNSDEYTAMKTALEAYVSEPKKSTMEAVQNAAARYIQLKKEGYHLSNTTSMRGTRLAYAREILSFAKEAVTSYDRRFAADQRICDISSSFQFRKLTEEYGTFIANQRPNDYLIAEEQFNKSLSEIEEPVNKVVGEQQEIIKSIKTISTSEKIRVEAVQNGEKELEALLG